MQTHPCVGSKSVGGWRLALKNGHVCFRIIWRWRARLWPSDRALAWHTQNPAFHPQDGIFRHIFKIESRMLTFYPNQPSVPGEPQSGASKAVIENNVPLSHVV